MANCEGEKRRILFLSSNSTWGGSEELWSAAAAVLAERGHRVDAAKAFVPPHEPRIERLRQLGCRIIDLRRVPFLPKRLTEWAVRLSWVLDVVIRALRLRWTLSRVRPELVVLSQGGNLDGIFYGQRLARRGIPYVLIVQKAAEMYWPSEAQHDNMRAFYAAARRCYFVSDHNRRLTEEQLGMSLPQAQVVRNPFAVPWESGRAWPEPAPLVKLACVGRIYPAEKGQDMLLRLLARPKWRGRPLHVSFYGSGNYLAPLEKTAAFLGLDNVSFEGFTRDVGAIWETHHALVLPSHCEGLPLVVVEAMLSGRVVITTDVAGNGEIVSDGENGFLAAAPSERFLDEALERAWARRPEWEQIGRRAAADARAAVPNDPAAAFAKEVLQVISTELPVPRTPQPARPGAEGKPGTRQDPRPIQRAAHR